MQSLKQIRIFFSKSRYIYSQGNLLCVCVIQFFAEILKIGIDYVQHSFNYDQKSTEFKVEVYR